MKMIAMHNTQAELSHRLYISDIVLGNFERKLQCLARHEIMAMDTFLDDHERNNQESCIVEKRCSFHRLVMLKTLLEKEGHARDEAEGEIEEAVKWQDRLDARKKAETKLKM